jgi:membrane-associated phospholipid phosphatase
LLPPIYNQTIQFRLSPIWSEYKKLLLLINIWFNSVVIHFNGKQKPWNFWCEHPLWFLYYKYTATFTYKMFIMMLYNFFYSIARFFWSYIIKLLMYVYDKFNFLLKKYLK